MVAIAFALCLFCFPPSAALANPASLDPGSAPTDSTPIAASNNAAEPNAETATESETPTPQPQPDPTEPAPTATGTIEPALDRDAAHNSSRGDNRDNPQSLPPKAPMPNGEGNAGANPESPTPNTATSPDASTVSSSPEPGASRHRKHGDGHPENSPVIGGNESSQEPAPEHRAGNAREFPTPVNVAIPGSTAPILVPVPGGTAFGNPPSPDGTASSHAPGSSSATSGNATAPNSSASSGDLRASGGATPGGTSLDSGLSTQGSGNTGANATNAGCPSIDYDTLQLPEKYFLTNLGQVTAVKSQDPWGSCWAFASTAALESAILKALDPLAGFTKDGRIDVELFKTPKLTGLSTKVDLSELAAAWFALRQRGAGDQAGEGLAIVYPSDSSLWREYQFAAGFDTYIEALWTAWQAVTREADAPYGYRGGDGYPDWLYDWNCMYEDWTPNASALGGSQQARVLETVYLPSPTGFTLENDGNGDAWTGYDESATDAIKRAVVRYGAVVVSCEADLTATEGVAQAKFTNTKHWAQYNDSAIPRFTHEVAIVGWDDSIPAGWFKAAGNATPPGNGAWLVKNSWGSAELYERWGIDADAPGIGGSGLFWLSYYDHSIDAPLAYVVELARNGRFSADHVYQYDYLGNAANYSLLKRVGDETLAANVFTARGNETLTQVSARTFTDNTEVTVWVYLLEKGDLDDNDPTNACEAAWSKSYFARYAGYHTFDAPQEIPLSTGQRFAVVQRQLTSSTDEATGLQTITSWAPLEAGNNVDALLKSGALALDRTGRYVLKAGVLGTDVPDVLAIARSNEGESYVRLLLDGDDSARWFTISQLNGIVRQLIPDGPDLVFGNALIKAFTVGGTVFAVDVYSGKAGVATLSEFSNGTSGVSAGVLNGLDSGDTRGSSFASDVPALMGGVAAGSSGSSGSGSNMLSQYGLQVQNALATAVGGDGVSGNGSGSPGGSSGDSPAAADSLPSVPSIPFDLTFPVIPWAAVLLLSLLDIALIGGAVSITRRPKLPPR